MTSSKQKIVCIKQAAETELLTKAQKLFNNLIKKIDAEKKHLLEWQEFIPKFQRKLADEYEVVLDGYNSRRIEMVNALDSAYENKIFKKADKIKIRHLITEISADLIAEHGKEELKELHDKHSDQDFDAIKQEADEMASEFIKSMMQGMYGVDLGDDFDVSAPEKYQELLQGLENKDAEKPHQTGAGRASRKKSAKQLEREARQQQEEQSISQSIREVYRKLTSALHPDREQNALERERKTEIMRRVNSAYAKKDLLSLLELQLEAEQIDQSHLNNIAEDRLKNFNKILKEQLKELQQEIDQIQYPFRADLKLPPHAVLTQKFILQHLEDDIRGIKADMLQLKHELKIFQNPMALKAWLKDYKIPKQSKFDDLDDLFFSGFAPPF